MGLFVGLPKDTSAAPMGLPEPVGSEQSLPRGTGLGILCWGHPMAVLLFTPRCVICTSSPLLNSHTLTSSLSNHLHHQSPSHTTTAKPSLPCQLLLPLAERERTLGRRNKGWEEREGARKELHSSEDSAPAQSRLSRSLPLQEPVWSCPGDPLHGPTAQGNCPSP